MVDIANVITLLKLFECYGGRRYHVLMNAWSVKLSASAS